MRTSAHKKARRHLASSKRSIIMACAGIAMILGTTSVGASMFGNDDPVLQRERSAGQPITNQEADDTGLSPQTEKPVTDQPVLGATTTAPTPRTKSTDTKATSPADPANVIDQTTPTPPPSQDTMPTNPGTPDPGDTTTDPPTPPPDDDGEVLGDSDTQDPPPTPPQVL